MPDPEEHPCARGLTVECFRTHPVWAKQALAVRLIHAITPKQLTKRLPPSINKALLVPGISFPPGFGPGDFPPGAIITPQTNFPPGWSAGDPLPPGAAAPPATAPETPGSSVVPPFYLGPGAPIYPGGSGQAPGVVIFFTEPFDDLTTNSWADQSYMGGSTSIVSANLRLFSAGGGAYSGVRRTHAVTWPTNWTVTFELNFVSGTGVAQVELYTGTYRVRIFLTPPTTVNILPRTGTCQATVANYLNTVNTWKLVVTGNLGTLYLNGSAVISGCDVFASSGSAGRMEWEAYDVHDVRINYMTITDDT